MNPSVLIKILQPVSTIKSSGLILDPELGDGASPFLEDFLAFMVSLNNRLMVEKKVTLVNSFGGNKKILKQKTNIKKEQKNQKKK
jgi:hypothetical protein